MLRCSAPVSRRVLRMLEGCASTVTADNGDSKSRREVFTQTTNRATSFALREDLACVTGEAPKA